LSKSREIIGTLQAEQWRRERRLLLVVALVLIALLLVTGTVVSLRFERDGARLYAEDLHALVAVGAHQLEEDFSEIGKLVEIFAFSRVIRSADRAELHDLLKQTVTSLRASGAVAALVVRGGELDMEPIGVLGAELEAHIVEDARLCLEQPGTHCIDRVTTAAGDHLIVISMQLAPGSPIEEDVVAVAIDWGPVSDHIIQQMRLDRWSRSFIVDRDGTLLAWSGGVKKPGFKAMKQEAGCAECHSERERYSLASADQVSVSTLEIVDQAHIVLTRPVRIGREQMIIGMVSPRRIAVQRLGSFFLWGVLLLVLLIATIAFVVLRLHRLGSSQVRALRHAGEQVRRLNEALEGKVLERTRQLHTAHNASQQLQRQQARLDRLGAVGELAAAFAHEVRTPLNALSIARQRLVRIARRGEAIEPDKAIELLDSQARDVEVINSYVENYLQFTRKARAGVGGERGPCQVEQLVQDVFGYVEPEARRSEVHLSTLVEPSELTVDLDQGKLRQVLINLVSNAVQAQPDGGKVIVRASQSYDVLRVEVVYHGPGIPEDQIEEVFEPFRSFREGGTGLGLAICQRLVREENATMRYYPGPGGGSVFAVVWPVLEEG